VESFGPSKPDIAVSSIQQFILNVIGAERDFSNKLSLKNFYCMKTQYSKTYKAICLKVALTGLIVAD
jgi:hypothetical protein